MPLISGLTAYPGFDPADELVVIDKSVTVGTNSGAGGMPSKATMAQLGITGQITAWTGVTFVNSWVNYVGNQACQYRKIGDIVEVRGLTSSGTLTGSAACFTLPSGFRPLTQQIFACTSNSVFGFFKVDTNGDVVPLAGSNVWFAVNCSFSTI